MKKLTTKQLESAMIRYRDLIGVPVADTGEPVAILNRQDIKNSYPRQMSEMASVLNNKIVLRKTVITMLMNAQRIVKKRNKNLSLFVTFGYRSLEIQTNIFQSVAAKIIKKRFFSDPVDFYEEVHRFIAVPSVAGHPTGGAVDAAIIDNNGKFIDFGGLPDDLRSKNCYVFSPNISKEARDNRLFLRACMTAVGFAPFDGEWWHFSYGDREWAFYYKKSKALYSQLFVSQVKSNLLQ